MDYERAQAVPTTYSFSGTNQYLDARRETTSPQNALISPRPSDHKPSFALVYPRQSSLALIKPPNSPQKTVRGLSTPPNTLTRARSLISKDFKSTVRDPLSLQVCLEAPVLPRRRRQEGV